MTGARAHSLSAARAQTRAGAAERKLEEAMAALREALSRDDLNRIRQGIETLSQALTRFGESIHRAAAAGGAGPGGAPGTERPSGEEDIVDAEFEDVDEPHRRQG